MSINVEVEVSTEDFPIISMADYYNIITVSTVGSALALFLFWSTFVGVDVILVWLVVLSCDDACNLIC